MARIIIAGASDKGRAQLSGLLASSGFDVFRACASGGELRRTLGECGDGILLVAGGLPHSRPDELAEDFANFLILLIGRPEVLAESESPQVFKLAWPCSGSALVGAVEMLSQLHAMRLPRRSGEDKALVERAKARLMAERGLTETEAHRQMQQYAMRHHMKMTETAFALLQGRNDDAR